MTARVREMLELVGLDPRSFAGRYPHELSGGERQRVGVARALAADPPLLLMDEPFGALDPPAGGDPRRVGALARGLGKTIVFVTHDLHEALSFGDRVALLARSRLVFLGGARDFLRSSEPEAPLLWRRSPLVPVMGFLAFLVANRSEATQLALEHAGMVALSTAPRS